MSEMIKKLNTRIETLENTNREYNVRDNTSNYQIPQRRYNQPGPTQSNYSKPNPMRQQCPTLPNSDNPQGLCYYHGSFGYNARKCDKDDCRWSSFIVPPHSCNLKFCPWAKFMAPIPKN